MTQKH